MKPWTTEEVQRYLGTYNECHVTWSQDGTVREDAASGGTVSQVLFELLEQGSIDGALVWRLDFQAERPTARPLIATTREEILRSRGSEYVAVSFASQAMPLLLAFDGKLAVTALPCDVSYLRRRMQRDENLCAKITCILGLFCGHNSEPELTELLLRRHGQQWQELTEFRYRRGKWRGRLNWETKHGKKADLSTREFTHLQNLHLCSQKKCLSCYDHFGYDADLSLGDAWSEDKRRLEHKPTLVVTRTLAGQQALAAAASRLHLSVVPPEEVLTGNSRGLIFHYNVSARAAVAPWFGLKINDRLRLPITSLDRLVAGFALANYRLGSTERGRALVARLPYSAIVVWILAFKALQQLNVWAYRPFPDSTQVSLIGATLEGNRGAQAMLETVMQQIESDIPNAQFVLHSYFANEDRKHLRRNNCRVVDASPLPLVGLYLPFSLLDGLSRAAGLKLPYWAMPSRVRLLASSSLLVDVSGISFADGREKFIPFNVLCILPAILHGVPVVKLAQSLGSFHSPLVRQSAKWMLRACQLVVARGSKSLEFVQGLGMDTELLNSPDLAFLFEASEEPQGPTKAFISELKRSAQGRPIVGLYVSEVVHQASKKAGINYVRKTQELVRSLVREGLHLVLIPNTNRDGTERHNNDVPLVRDCLAGLGPSEHVSSVTFRADASDLRHITRAVDVVVASRFHGMVAALALTKPCYVIGWGHKYADTMRLFGQEARVGDYRSFEVSTVAADVLHMVRERSAISKVLAGRLEAVRSKTRIQFDRVLTMLRPAPTTQDFEEYSHAKSG